MGVYDALIVGAGHNGLVCGAYLAKAGLKVLALERRKYIGGPAVSEETWPGFTVSVAAFTGLEVVPTPPSIQPFPDQRCLIFWPDLGRTCSEIAKFSASDAKAYPAYVQHMERLAVPLRRLLFEIPFDPTTGHWKDMVRAAGFLWRYRNIGPALYDIWDLLTMSAHDFLGRWFDSPEMLAALGSYASGSGSNISPKSPGSAYVLARPFLRDPNTQAGPGGLVRGGMGRIAAAIAQSGARFGLATRTEAEVKEILIQDGRAKGVHLANGEEIRSEIVIANANAKTTFLKLLPPGALDP